MSTAVSDHPVRLPRPVKYRAQREGITLLASMVALMWIVEIINTIDSNRLDSDGIWARSVSHLWGIVTAPFLHASFQHLLANTVPLVFLGVIIALHGARRLALVTVVVILLGGLGTWLIAPSHSITVGASGLVFGYATYLLVRGFFDRSALEVLVGIVVGVIWGAALIGSLVPQGHVSWQGHLCGGIAGVIAAYGLRKPRAKPAAAAPAAAQ
ncbi:MAG TPA: rhomboid family intramembrane serine protease [Solirubrobacteraceae bacterium]|nr:rhomboid family intramembrane serine protease [Solirubrobacteraceae bacterium]